MPGRLKGLILKDLKNVSRNYYFVVITALALLFVVAIYFFIPADMEIKPDAFYYNEYSGEMRKALDNIFTEEELGSDKMHIVDSRDEVLEGLKGSINSIGIVVKKGNDRPVVEMVFQGFENQALRNILKVSIQDNLNSMVKENADFETMQLKQHLDIRDIPSNKNMLPVFLMSEAAMVGFVLIAALVFMEKEEGSVTAYNVTPGRVPEYIASKIIVMNLLGWSYSLMMTLPVAGRGANYMHLFLIIGVAGIFTASLGLITSSFFQNISQSIIWLVVINLVLGLPMVSYFVPSFAPFYVKMMPTYPLLFGIREAVFPTGNTQIISNALLVLTAAGALSYIIATYAYRANMFRD
jgi:hypothetical protein